MQGELLQKPVNGFRLRPYTGRMPPYPFPEPLPGMIITSACVATSEEGRTMWNVNTHVRRKSIHFAKCWEEIFAWYNEEAAMQSTETSEWGFNYGDGTTGRFMQMRVVETKNEVDTPLGSFPTSCFPDFQSKSPSPPIHPLAAMVVFHLINPLPVDTPSLIPGDDGYDWGASSVERTGILCFPCVLQYGGDGLLVPNTGGV